MEINQGAAALSAGETQQQTQVDLQPQATQQSQVSWTDGLNIDSKYIPAINAKGWASANDILESYVNVEKLVSLERGGDVDRIIVRPKADASQEEIAAFRAKAGFTAPATPADYGFTPELMASKSIELFNEVGLPQDMAQRFTEEMTPMVEAASTWMKEANVPKDVAASLVNNVLRQEAAAIKEFHAKSDKEYGDLVAELGSKFDDFQEAGRRAFRVSGINKDSLDKIEMAVGTKTMLQMFARFGQAMSEAAAPQPDKQGGIGQFAEASSAAIAKIAALRSDAAFQSALMSPDFNVKSAAVKTWEDLHKAAYPT